MEKKTGGAAFPRPYSEDKGKAGELPNWHKREAQPGMSLRDYFAAKALMGWMSNPTATPAEAHLKETATPQDMANVAAHFAYMVADAMIAEREK